MYKTFAVISTAVSLLLFSPFASANYCAFEKWGEYAGLDLYRNAAKTAYTFRTDYVGIDADGAPNAYHPDDQPLHCTNGVGFKGLDCPANAGYPNKKWWKDVLVVDPDNDRRAYVQTSGSFAGYFVSMTSLKNKSIPDVKNPKRYVDATQIPYLVFPGNFYRKKGTGRLGDVGYAMNRRTGMKSAFVVADIGPGKAPLGEMSIRLAELLGGKAPNARTGVGKPTGDNIFVLFPYSTDAHAWPMTASQIEKVATNLLKDAGGFKAVLRCGASDKR